MSQCLEYRDIDYYDRWVVPHQLLPFTAVLFGVDFRTVLLITYFWESLEVILFNCLGVSEEEKSSNALISDPVEAVLGIIIAELLIKINDEQLPVVKNRYRSYMAGIIAILPSTLIISNKSIWGYPILLLSVIFIINYYLNDNNIGFWLLYTILYVISFSYVIFALENVFNSFYTSLMISTFFIFAELIYLKQMKKYIIIGI